MADLRIPSLPVPRPSAAPANPAASEAVRAAQQAFFQTALGQIQASAPAARAAPATTAEPGPQRPLRPGSLLDIKV